jgi:hypothetical protein
MRFEKRRHGRGAVFDRHDAAALMRQKQDATVRHRIRIDRQQLAGVGSQPPDWLAAALARAHAPTSAEARL